MTKKQAIEAARRWAVQWCLRELEAARGLGLLAHRDRFTAGAAFFAASIDLPEEFDTIFITTAIATYGAFIHKAQRHAVN